MTSADAALRPIGLARGLALAATALAMTAIGSWGPSTLILIGALDPVDEVATVRVFLAGSALALLGLVPLALASLALTGRAPQPAWLLRLAVGLLLVRPIVVLIELIAAPIAVVPQELALPLFLTTPIAAGVAAVAVLPTTGPARRPERIAVVGLAVAALVGLALFGYTGAILPLVAIGLVIAFALRMRRDRAEAALEEEDRLREEDRLNEDDRLREENRVRDERRPGDDQSSREERRLDDEGRAG